MTESAPDLEGLRRLYAQIAEHNEFYDWLDVRPVAVDRGRVVGELPFDERLTTPRATGVSTLHGGILATLVDLSAVAAVLTTRERRPTVVTDEIDVSFHRTVRETVVAEAEVVEDEGGRTVASVVVRTDLSDPSTTVASGEVTCQIS